MKMLIHNLSTWLLFFLSTFCFSQSNSIKNNYCLVVMSNNKTIDKVIYEAAKALIPGCIDINKIGDFSKIGIIEIYLIEKSDVSPEPWLKNSTISNNWYHEWKGVVPNIRSSANSQKQLRQILYLNNPVYGMRIFYPGQQTPVQCEMITKFDISVRELGIEYATNAIRIKTSRIVQDCFRLHPEICTIDAK